MLNVKTSESFDRIIKNLSKSGRYLVVYKGTRKIIRANGREIAIFRPGIPNPELQNKEARKLMSAVKASVTRYLKKNNFNVPEIKKEYPVVFTNRLFWESIPVNTEFYIIDAKHAYWRIAYILGYVNQKLYDKYADNKDLKQVKNISLAILNSIVRSEYYLNNNKTHEIECDTSLYSRVYNNIRFFSYNLCGRLRNDLDDSCFAYRTDGVFLLKPGLNRAKKIFEANNLLYKLEKYTKIDNKTYSTVDGELKKFM